jgi:tripartite-type tricarboxylate transporter receptor subunit TctC
VDRLHAEIANILDSADFKAALAKLGTDQTPAMSQADLNAWLKTETARWRRIIDLTHIYGD